MRSLGIDVGSRTIKVAVLEHGRLVFSNKSDTTDAPIPVARRLLEGQKGYDSITATGCGSLNFRSFFDCQVISDKKALGQGARFFFPEAEVILDIGGQDTKAIALDITGNITQFYMNDSCAAGTGRIMETMADALHYSVSEFGIAASEATQAEKISNMGNEFAESEAVSLITGGAKREEVALGIHEAIASRALSVLSRLPEFKALVFTGGVAYNPCIYQIFSKRLGITIFVPPDPQIVGALGAALAGTLEQG
jgi:predicted CoA-substrate-specific enzyme activase